jgi:hypothetical protein
MIAIVVAVGLLPILSAFWAYDDAERRGKSGCLVALLVLFVSWPVGLILWLVFRPEPRH